MPGIKGLNASTYIVNNAAGITKDRFVMGVANSDGTVLNCQMPTGANVDCVGVAAATYANTDTATIYDQEGDVVWVDSDNSAAVGDNVTNDANGKATKILDNATDVHYWSHGKVMEKNTSTYQLKVKLHKMKFYS